MSVVVVHERGARWECPNPLDRSNCFSFRFNLGSWCPLWIHSTGDPELLH